MRGGVTDAGQPTNQRTVKIELLSQWKLEAEFRNFYVFRASMNEFLPAELLGIN